MKATFGKELHQLSPSARNRIYDRMDEELIMAQFIMMKQMCCSLGDMGMPTDKILEFLAGYQRFYRQNSRFTSQEELMAFLDKRLANIFGEGGFPEEYLQSFRNIGRR